MDCKGVCIKKARGMGRGVFATKPFAKGETIEVCPVIVLSFQAVKRAVERTSLGAYHFLWGTEDDTIALALGYGSLYNHSPTPNAKYVKNIKGQTIRFVATRPIKRGEQIFVYYKGWKQAGVRLPEWFDG